MTPIHLAANRGDIGGGEVMLMRLAEALGLLGYDVTVVAPSTPGDLAAGARANGLAVQEIVCHDRRSYAWALRRWDRGRHGLLWCNGLLPALATAGKRQRIVHLHQDPQGLQGAAALVARWRTAVVLVPSEYLRSRVRGSAVLPNWTADVTGSPKRAASGHLVVGVLGRTGTDKGTHVLAAACSQLPDEVRTGLTLLVAGDGRFSTARDRLVVDAALDEAASSGVTIERAGWMDRDAYFARVDVSVVPSVWQEPFGLVAAEAMAAGLPLIVSDAGALPEVVGDQHPWIVPADDADALSAALAQALARWPATDVVTAQRKRWVERFSPAAGLRHLSELMAGLSQRGLVDADPHPPMRGGS